MIGIHLSSSTLLLPSGGVRADIGIRIGGGLGWTHFLTAYDTDDATVLFDVDQSGHVGIRKTPAAGYSLDIAGPAATTALMRISGAASRAAKFDLVAGGATNSIQTDTSGNLSISADAVAGDVIKMIHTGAIANSLVVGAAGAIRMAGYGAGTATFDGSGNITSVSDERKKNIIGGFGRGLEHVLALNPIRYSWREDSGLDVRDLNVGFSAQEVQGVIPEAVGMDPQGYLTFNDRPVIAALVNAVKEINARLETVGA